MTVKVLTIKLYAAWVNSLKEKRMVVKGLCEKLRNELHVSVIESDAQDILKSVVISIAILANTAVTADSISESVLRFIEKHTDAEIIDIFMEDR